MKKLLFGLLMLFSSLLVAQPDTFKDAYLRGELKKGHKSGFSAERVLFLENFYGQVRYPISARINAVEAVFKVAYTVLKDGTLNIDSCELVRIDEVLDITDYNKVILVRDYIVPLIDISYANPTPRRPPPKPLYHRVLFNFLGKWKLEREIRRVFSLFPPFHPAKHCGRPINWSYTEYIIFDLE